MPKNKSTLLRLKDWQDNINLHTVSWRFEKLQNIQLAYNLRDGEAAVFVNRPRTRVRMVAILNGCPVLILLPIDPRKNLSLELEVSLFLRKLQTTSTITRKKMAELEDKRQQYREFIKNRKQRFDNKKKEREQG